MNDTQYEYKNVKVLSLSRGGRRRGAKAQEKLMNKMATDGWEPIDTIRKGMLEWGSKDTITFRRPKKAR